MEELGVPLDEEQRGVLATLNTAVQSFDVRVFVGRRWQDASRPARRKSLLGEARVSKPRCNVLYTMRAKALREEVVLEFLQFKAGS